MITPEFLNEIMYKVEDTLSSLNEYLIRRIAKRITHTFTADDGKLFIPATISDMHSLMKNGVLVEDIEEALVEVVPEIEKEVRQAFLESADEICRQNLDIAQKIVVIEGLSSVNVPKYEQVGITADAEVLEMTPTEIRKLEDMYKRTNAEIRNFTRTTAGIAYSDYVDACDNAYMKVQHGGVSIQQAVIEAIKEVSAKGIQVIEYDSGRTTRIESAIARAVRTGINQANSDIVLQRCAEMGVGFVKVSAHLGARVTKSNDYTNHAWWQGQVYKIDWDSNILSEYKASIKNESGRFGWLVKMRTTLTGRIKKMKYKYPDFVKTTGYGNILGLAGINCRHSFYPFYPDIEIGDNDAPDMSENEKRYKAEQKARGMERSIRETKRYIEGLKAAGQDVEGIKDSIKEQRSILREQMTNYMDFCKANGLKPRNMALMIN